MAMHSVAETPRRPPRRLVSNDQLTCLLINLLELQLWRGCFQPNCHQRMCASGRRRETRRPAREYSRLSARATAAHLATVTHPEQYLCSYLREKYLPEHGPSDRPSFEEVLQRVQDRLDDLAKLESPEQAEPKKDPKSFPQHLFDTTAFRAFLRFGRPRAYRPKDHLDYEPLAQVHKDAVELEYGLQAWVTNSKACEDSPKELRELRNLLFDTIVTMSDVAPDVTSAGYLALCRVPWGKHPVLSGLASNTILAISSLAQRYSIAERRKLWDQVGSVFLRWSYALLMTGQQIFLESWNGKANLWQSSAGDNKRAIHALFAMKEIFDNDPNDVIVPEFLEDHPTLCDASELASSWMHYRKMCEKDDHKTIESACIAEFPQMLSRQTAIVMFRGICFWRMRAAWDASLINVKVMRRTGEALGHDRRLLPHFASLQSGLLRNATLPFLTIQARRSHLLEDTYNDLWRRQRRELLRPLRVRIVGDGEIGNDQGGLSQELLRLAIIDIMNPDKGMFTIDPQTHLSWFLPSSLEPDYKFELAGMLIGLAVHNGYTLPVSFPLALYSKLTGKLVGKSRLTTSKHVQHGSTSNFTIDAIREGWPDLARNLEKFQDYDGEDFEDVFGLDFTYNIAWIDGGIKQINYLESPGALSADWCYLCSSAQGLHEDRGLPKPASYQVSSFPVTRDSRLEYVKWYIFNLVEESVSKQYDAFEKGFKTILDDEILKTTTPGILRSLVEGDQQDIDTVALAEATMYGEDYGADSDYIDMFWSVVHDLPQDRKKRLLEFVTASDRIPVTGIETIPFKIEKSFDAEMLPTSHTCFGQLRLPEYPSREVLEQKLNIALDYAEGFGNV